MTDDHVVPVEIFGQQYKLRGTGESGHIHEVAAVVDRKMREIHESTRIVDSLKLAILTALNLADELNAVRKELASRPANQTAEVQASLQELLDEAMKID